VVLKEVRAKALSIIQNKANVEIADEDEWFSHVMDSLSKYELIYELEDAFGVSIPDEVGSTWETIREALDWLEEECTT
jgi:acyl carrier protein